MPAKNRSRTGRFVKGRSGNPRGRPKSTPNRVTVAMKEFMSALVDDPEVQEAVRQKVLSGDTTAFFRAAEMVHGKPRQSLDVGQRELKMFIWPDDSDIAEG